MFNYNYFTGFGLFFTFREHLLEELSGVGDLAVADKLPVDTSLCEETSIGPRDFHDFRLRWDTFVESMVAQWQLVDYVSAVFVGTIATMLQDPSVSTTVLGRTFATVAFLCALCSLCMGLILSSHMAKIKSVSRARTWIANFQQLSTTAWMHPASVLSAPAIWLLWSAVFLALTLLTCYVWQPRAPAPPAVPRIAVGGVLLAWAAQTLAAVWTLRALRATPASAPAGPAAAAQARDVEMQPCRGGAPHPA